MCFFFHLLKIVKLCFQGKLSRSMGMKNVMDELYKMRRFTMLAEFYIKWAEVCITPYFKHGISLHGTHVVEYIKIVPCE